MRERTSGPDGKSGDEQTSRTIRNIILNNVCTLVLVHLKIYTAPCSPHNPPYFTVNISLRRPPTAVPRAGHARCNHSHHPDCPYPSRCPASWAVCLCLCVGRPRAVPTPAETPPICRERAAAPNGQTAAAAPTLSTSQRRPVGQSVVYHGLGGFTFISYLFNESCFQASGSQRFFFRSNLIRKRG